MVDNVFDEPADKNLQYRLCRVPCRALVPWLVMLIQVPFAVIQTCRGDCTNIASYPHAWQRLGGCCHSTQVCPRVWLQHHCTHMVL